MKLHIGGKTLHPDWKIFDAIAAPGVDYVGDASQLKFNDGTIDALYASHVLEHFPLAQVSAVLIEWHRVLAPCGTLYLSVPCFDTLARLVTEEKDDAAKFHLMRIMFGGQTNRYDFHYCGLYWDIIAATLAQIGFENITKIDRLGVFEDSSTIEHRGQLISLNVIATKSEPPG